MSWELLDLDPETATERDVKRAYAKRLKVTRPDQDPAGFQELREAYEGALMELQLRSMTGAATGAELPEEDKEDQAGGGAIESMPGRFERPEEFEAGLGRLRDALHCGEGVAEATRGFEQVLYSHPELVADWGAEMAALVEAGVATDGFELTVDALLFELEHDSPVATVAVIEHAEGTGGKEAIRSLAALLLENKARFANPAGGKALARLASAAAVWEPTLTKRLADAAYELLPTGWRDHLMDLIESDLGLGQFVQELPEEWRPFWVKRLRDPEGGWDWMGPDSAAALECLRRHQPNEWLGFKLIARLLPEDLAGELLAPRPRPVSTPPPLPPPVQFAQVGGSSGNDSKGSPALMVVGCLVAIAVIKGMVALLREPDSPADLPRSQPPRSSPAYPPSTNPAHLGPDWEDPARSHQRLPNQDRPWRGSPSGPSGPTGPSIPSGPRPPGFP